MQPYPLAPDLVWPGHLHGTGCLSARAVGTGFPTVGLRLWLGPGCVWWWVLFTPARCGWGLGWVCLGSVCGVVPLLPAVCGVRGCALVSACFRDQCGFVRVSLAPRRFRFRCAVWACVLGPGLGCAPPFLAGLSGCVFCAFFFFFFPGCWVSLSRALWSLTPSPFFRAGLLAFFFFFCLFRCSSSRWAAVPGLVLPVLAGWSPCTCLGVLSSVPSGWGVWPPSVLLAAVWWLWAVFAPPPPFFWGGGRLAVPPFAFPRLALALWLVCGVVGPSPLLAEVPVCYSPPLLAGFRCRWWWAVPATPGWGLPAAVVCGGGVLVGLWLVCGVVGPSPLLAEVPVCYSPPLLAGFRCRWWWAVPATPGWGLLAAVVCGVWCVAVVCWWGCGWCVVWLVPRNSWRRFLCATPRHSWLGFAAGGGGRFRHSWLGSAGGGGVWRWCVGGVVAGVWCGWSLATPGGGSCVLLPATPGWVSLPLVVGGPRHSWLGSACGGGVWCVVCGGGVLLGLWLVCGVVGPSPLLAEVPVCYSPPLLAGFRCRWWWAVPATPGWRPLAAVVCGVWCVVCGVWRWCVGGVVLVCGVVGPSPLLAEVPVCYSPPLLAGFRCRWWWAVPATSGWGPLAAVVCGVWCVAVVCWWGCGWCVVWLVPRHSWRRFLCATPRHSWLGFAAAGGGRSPPLLAGVRWRRRCVVCGGGVLLGLWLVYGVVGPSPLLAEVPVCYSPPLLAGFRCRWWWAVPATPGWGPLAAVVCRVWCGVWCVVGVPRHSWRRFLCATPRHSWLGFAAAGGGRSPPLLAGVRWRRWCACFAWPGRAGRPPGRVLVRLTFSFGRFVFLLCLAPSGLGLPLSLSLLLPFLVGCFSRPPAAWLAPRLCLPLGRWLLFGGCSPPPPFVSGGFRRSCLWPLWFFFFLPLLLPPCAPGCLRLSLVSGPGCPGPRRLRCLFCWPSASRLSVRLSLFRAFRLVVGCSRVVAAPPPPLCLAVFVPAARCCVPCCAVRPWVRCCAALLRVVSPGVVLSCAVLRSFGAAACCAVPSGAARCPGALCSAALCFAVFPRAVCSVLCVFCRGVVVRAVVRRSALRCVCLGVLCCAFLVLSVLCGAVLRCAGALALCCSCGACCCWRLLLWCATVCCAVSCGVPWCGAGSGGPWLSAGGVFRCRCPCLAAWSASLWLVWFAVVPCFPVLCSVVLCCRVVLCCCALLSCCGAVGACFALLWAVVLCCVVLLVGCAVFGPVVVSACCGALFLALCVSCLFRSVRCGALLCWLWCPASLCRVLWRCAVVWCCAVVLCCRFAVLFVFAVPSCGLSCGASVVCAVVGASCCGVSLCVVVSPWAFCGVVVLLWCVVVSCCAVRCPVVSCALCRVLRCRAVLRCCAGWLCCAVVCAAGICFVLFSFA